MPSSTEEKVMDSNAAANKPALDQPIVRSSWLRRISKAFQRLLRTCFFNLGWIIAGNPWKTIALAFLFTGICAIGLISFRTENRRNELWIPKGTLALKHLDSVTDNFSGTAYRRKERIIFTSNVEGRDVATQSSLLELVNVLQVSEATSVVVETEVVNLADLCTKSIDETGVSYCYVSSIVDLFYDRDFITTSPPNFLATVKAKIETLTDADVKSILGAPVYKSWNGRDLFQSRTIGRSTGTDASIMIEAFFVELSLDSIPENRDGRLIDARVRAWEREWIRRLNDMHSANANIYVLSDISEMDESEASQATDFRKVFVGYTLLTIYVLVMLGHVNRLNSRFLLGTMGLLSIGLAFIATMGIGSATGFPYTIVHQSLLLLMFAIGIDDAFVITVSFDRTDSALPIHERMAWALSDAGFAITVTSFTNACAFSIGSITRLPALRSFCVWAAIGIIFDYILQLTFFVACFTLDSRRREKGKMDVLICLPANTDGVKDIFGHSSGILARLFEKKISSWLLSNKIRWTILFVTLVLFGASIYGMTQLEQEFNVTLFYNEGTYVKTFDDIDKAYSDEIGIPVIIFTGRFDYANVTNQQHLTQLLSPEGKLGKNEWVTEGTLNSWYPRFRAFASLNGTESTLTPDNFYPQFQAFLNSSVGSTFADDFKLEDVTGSSVIVASKSSVILKYLKNNDEEVSAMLGLREAVDSANVPIAFPFSHTFLFFEQLAVMVKEALQIIFFALAVIFIMTLLLIANPLVSIVVLLGVGFSIVDILGAMYFWGIELNSVSVIDLSLAVGLTIDSAAHIGLAFMEAVGTRRERVTIALKHLGPPLIHGSVSTLLAISVLAFSVSYVFRTFYKMFLLIIIFGAFHGMLFVPILLGLFGPPGYYATEEEKKRADTKIAGNRIREKQDESLFL